MSANAGAMTRRNIVIFLLRLGVCGGCAALLAQTLPKTDLPWLALPALAGLFWSWRQQPWPTAVGWGFFAGLVYFSLAFSWFGETAASLLGRFGSITVLGPALLAAPFFALAALAINRAERYAAAGCVALASALGFSLCEALRSLGPIGDPFAQVAYPQITTPFGLVAPWFGTAGVSAMVAFVAASFTDYFLFPTTTRRFVASLAISSVLLGAAWHVFPAREYAAAHFPIAIIQGNIRQELKWSKGAFDLALNRYLGLSNTLVDLPNGPAPKLIVWPETVIPTNLNDDPALAKQFAHLAQRADATLVVGTLAEHNGTPYNTLWYFAPHQEPAIYRKRRLVPFAEWLPGEAWLDHLPFTNLISHFGAGQESSVIAVGQHQTAPLICWESDFPDLLHDQLMRKADLAVVATDDAWFGDTAGPYQHAQIAQMRALENGIWIVRAAATGVSGIIAPDGSFTQRSVVNQIQVIQGLVGDRIPTVFARLGPAPITLSLALGYLLTLFTGLLWRRNVRSS